MILQNPTCDVARLWSLRRLSPTRAVTYTFLTLAACVALGLMPAAMAKAPETVNMLASVDLSPVSLEGIAEQDFTDSGLIDDEEGYPETSTPITSPMVVKTTSVATSRAHSSADIKGGAKTNRKVAKGNKSNSMACQSLGSGDEIETMDSAMIEPEFLESIPTAQGKKPARSVVKIQASTKTKRVVGSSDRLAFLNKSGSLAFAHPAPGTSFSSGFGWRSGRPHQGVDLAGAIGTPINAAASGRVIYAGWESGYGKMVLIDHGQDHGRSYQTRYAHLGKIQVSVGDTVRSGQSIGAIGMTGRTSGPHLHFEVLVNHEPRNPMAFLGHGPVLALRNSKSKSTGI
jgi:murein DD-endopeptidase MepM/ murein hydrolase activator NlpD